MKNVSNVEEIKLGKSNVNLLVDKRKHKVAFLHAFFSLSNFYLDISRFAQVHTFTTFALCA